MPFVTFAIWFDQIIHVAHLESGQRTWKLLRKILEVIRDALLDFMNVSLRNIYQNDARLQRKKFGDIV